MRLLHVWLAATLFLSLSTGLTACDDGGAGGGADASLGGSGGGGAGGGGGAAGGVGRADARVPDAAREPACSDGVDNDGDGLTDHPDDPGCESPDDRDENDPLPVPDCADGLDNDQDGFTDFPADPGCGSDVDDDELNPPPPPGCNDGFDNDRDGLFDEQDPGCASVADPSEDDPEETPACSNGEDDDGDGITDFPFEPGCSTAGDDDETDSPQAPACANGQDDDGDALTDYPDDPGCAGVGDRDETDKLVTPACADHVDNDRDGKIDYPDDDGCEAASDHNERGSCGDTYDPPRLRDGETLIIDTSGGVFSSEGSCGGRGSPELAFLYRLERDVEALHISTVGLATAVPTTLYVRRVACLDPEAEIACQREEENVEEPGHTLVVEAPSRGEHYVFVDGVAGAGGSVALTVTEVPLAQCLNGLDDDEDGHIDYPSDPGCETPIDRDELTPDPRPACANDEDDDNDGLVDFPLDVGCISAASEDEADRCGQGVRFREYFFGHPFVTGDTSEDGESREQGSCGGGNAPEIIYHYYNPFNSRIVVSTAHPETEFQSVVYVRGDCADGQSQIACDDGTRGGSDKGRVVLDRAAVGDYWIFVDPRFGQGGTFRLSVEVERLDPGCSDGRDNDGDGQVDGDDPGCVGPGDEDEADPPAGTPRAACGNGLDDDGDGESDYPYDPGCSAVGDDDEADPDEAPACANGLDDDDDGRPDFPLDAGCQSRGDDEERNPVPAPACGNRIDDDADGRIDYPFDPGCQAAGDPDETDPVEPAVCGNGVDDDRDGIADFPFDPGCEAAAAPDETDPVEPPVCSNGADDDEDGLTDFPIDWGCGYAAAPDEAGGRFAPQCGNGRDDDGDGRTDFPDDPGCRFAADNGEENAGQLPPRCADGVDNDLDGSIDLRDIGCVDGDDDDEADPPDVPLCGNGDDDDGDGQVDWPDDPGCRARGDLTEDQSCRPEVDTPRIPQNGRVAGATEENGADRYRSRCGGLQAPDAVYRYTLGEAATLRISADNPGTDFPVVISVRNDCEEPDSMLMCAGNFARPEPTLVLRDAEPGEYFIIVDGGGPERYVSRGEPVNMPDDPDGYRATHDDLRADCWNDGGGDAFDCFGETTVRHAGQEEAVDITVGQHDVNVGGYALTVQSDWAHQNLLRLRFLPQEDFDERPVTIRVTGNLGSDFNTVAAERQIGFQGRQLTYYQTAQGSLDRPDFDPPVVYFMVPSDPEQLGSVHYANAGDDMTVTATDIKLPATFYLAVTFANHAATAAAILEDIELQAGPAGNDAPRFGSFELTVSEE